MRTLSFENLRRLVGRRKDRDEPSFERSESFKRISIRKSYLDRGKRRTRLQKTNDVSDNTTTAPVVTIEVSSHTRTKNIVSPTIVHVPGGVSVSEEFDLGEKKDKKISHDDVEVIGINEEIEEDDDEDEKKMKRGTPAGTIVYGQWLNDLDSSYSSRDRKSRIDSYSSQESKFNFDFSREKIYISQENRQFTKRNIVLPPIKKINDNEDKRRVSSVLIELDKSPHFQRLQSKIQHRNGVENMQTAVEYKARNFSNNYKCGGVTVNVRSDIWRDSTSAVAKTSYSLTSLKQDVESDIDDKYNERSAIEQTISVPDKSVTNKTDTASTKTSGFSLSLSFSRLTTDIRAAALTTKNGLFRRRKRASPMKPAPSVSAEGYFERTAAAVSSARRSRRNSVGTARRRSTYTSRRRKITTSKPGLALDTPVWFVPPERRRSNRQHGRVWREIRCLPQEDGKSDGDNLDNRSHNWSNDSNLSDEFDDKKLLLSGDFEEKPETLQNSRKMESGSTLDSSSLLSSATSLVSLKPKISDFNEDKIFYEGYRVDKTKPIKPIENNFFASSQFLGFVAKSTAENGAHNSRYDCTSSSESEPEKQRRVLLVVGGNKKDAKDALNLNVTEAKTTNERRNCSVVLVVEGQRSHATSRQQEVGPGQRRRPLRRRSQLKRGTGIGGNNTRGQPVYLARRRSSLRRRPCSKRGFKIVFSI